MLSAARLCANLAGCGRRQGCCEESARAGRRLESGTCCWCPPDGRRVAVLLVRSWRKATRSHGGGNPRLRLGNHGEMQWEMYAGWILLPAAGKPRGRVLISMPGCALCEMLAVTATRSVSAVTLLWDQLGDASMRPKKKKKKGKEKRNVSLLPCFNPVLAGVAEEETDLKQFPVLSVPGDVS